jgi:hypothetical protein
LSGLPNLPNHFVCFSWIASHLHWETGTLAMGKRAAASRETLMKKNVYDFVKTDFQYRIYNTTNQHSNHIHTNSTTLTILDPFGIKKKEDVIFAEIQ